MRIAKLSLGAGQTNNRSKLTVTPNILFMISITRFCILLVACTSVAAFVSSGASLYCRAKQFALHDVSIEDESERRTNNLKELASAAEDTARKRPRYDLGVGKNAPFRGSEQNTADEGHTVLDYIMHQPENEDISSLQ